MNSFGWMFKVVELKLPIKIGYSNSNSTPSFTSKYHNGT